MNNQAYPVLWRKNLEIAYFEQEPGKKQGNWELDLNQNRLYWSKDQYQLYGYEPGELTLNDEFFILKTTHISDLKRISGIVAEAISNKLQYNFKRRILKKNGRIGFAETHALIIRSI